MKEIWMFKTGSVLLPERRKIKPIGKYMPKPEFNYSYWDFTKDIIKDFFKL